MGRRVLGSWEYGRPVRKRAAGPPHGNAGGTPVSTRDTPFPEHLNSRPRFRGNDGGGQDARGPRQRPPLARRRHRNHCLCRRRSGCISASRSADCRTSVTASVGGRLPRRRSGICSDAKQSRWSGILPRTMSFRVPPEITPSVSPIWPKRWTGYRHRVQEFRSRETRVRSRSAPTRSSPPTRPTTTTSPTPIFRTSSTSGCTARYDQPFPNSSPRSPSRRLKNWSPTPYRHGSKDEAETFFLDGMTRAMQRLAKQTHPAFPVTIYYAFKQSERKGGAGVSSTGWETFLGAVIRSGFTITGTWPMRTELGNRMIGKDANALASSIILVCRRRSPDTPPTSRRDFLAALRSELPPPSPISRRATSPRWTSPKPPSAPTWPSSPATPACWKPTARRCRCAPRSSRSTGCWTRPWPGRKAIWTRTPDSASPGTSNMAWASAPAAKPKCCSASRTPRSRACSAPGWSWAARARSGSGAATRWTRTGTRRRTGASPIGRARNT